MSNRYEIKGENQHGGKVSAWTTHRSKARDIMRYRKKAGWIGVHIVDHGNSTGGPTRVR